MNETDREWSLVPIVDVPSAIGGCLSLTSRSGQIVQEFFESGEPTVLLMPHWLGDNPTPKQVRSTAQALRGVIKRSGLPVKVCERGWRIFLQRVEEKAA